MKKWWLVVFISAAVLLVYIVMTVYSNESSDLTVNSSNIDPLAGQSEIEKTSQDFIPTTDKPDLDVELNKSNNLLAQDNIDNTAKCKDAFEQLQGQIFDKINSTSLLEERLPLFLLTGLNELVSNSLVTSPDDRPWNSPAKKLQLELLKEASEDGESPLYTQLYIEACATSDVPEFCKDEDLTAAAENSSDNISVWLSLINFYRNQGDFEKIEEIIEKASSSVRLDNLQSEYYQEVFDTALTLTGSPKYSAYLMLNYTGNRLYGLNVLKKYCNEKGGESCFKIGQVLQKYSSRNEAKKAGIELQIDYFRETLNVTDFSSEKEALKQIEEKVASNFNDLNIPFNDEMAYFLADNLSILDESEYFQTIKQKAESIITDNPSLCTW
ncbi:hypothetical protein [Glaciecola petra]|uniref:Uncharacterized protein n=1 Tax=Glaciecola petra TaxID=3075602 RepID=A0ABU2ZQA6_9ALTE|nr:hypothetical protein [Aestuariibacter sp. P117]MDT0594808.1 hypothetical protein [Aestuariibacter sp. P117]